MSARRLPPPVPAARPVTQPLPGAAALSPRSPEAGPVPCWVLDPGRAGLVGQRLGVATPTCAAGLSLGSGGLPPVGGSCICSLFLEQGSLCTSNPACEGPGARPAPTSGLVPVPGEEGGSARPTTAPEEAPPAPERPPGAAGPSPCPPGSQLCVTSARPCLPRAGPRPPPLPQVLALPKGVPGRAHPQTHPNCGRGSGEQRAPGTPQDSRPRKRLRAGLPAAVSCSAIKVLSCVCLAVLTATMPPPSPAGHQLRRCTWAQSLLGRHPPFLWPLLSLPPAAGPQPKQGAQSEGAVLGLRAGTSA